MVYTKLKIWAIIQIIQEKKYYFHLLFPVNWTKSLCLLTYLDNYLGFPFHFVYKQI